MYCLIMAYTSVYKGYRQAQNNIGILVSIIANKPLDGLILASIGQNKYYSYAQVFPQVIQKKSPKIQ